MKCFACGQECESEDQRFSFKTRMMQYNCEACSVVWVIYMKGLYRPENNLILNKGKWKTKEKWDKIGWKN